MKIFKTIFLSVIMLNIGFAQTNFPELNKLISEGNFSPAKEFITKLVNSNQLDEMEKLALLFEAEKMERIKKDFKKSPDDILPAIKKYFPDVNNDMIKKLEEEKSLEYMIIDGEKKYFNNSVPNLFRINSEAKRRKSEVEGTRQDELKTFLQKHLPQSVEKIKAAGKKIGNAVNIKFHYTLTVNADAVPDGEILRCWLPFPREGHNRQTGIKLLSVNSDEYIIADNRNLQRTLYLEKTAKQGNPTIFQMSIEYTSYSEWYILNPDEIKSYDVNSSVYKDYTRETAPHIVFTNEIKELSKKIIGGELNPYKKLKRIFEWINNNIPWASAREYSTLDNIPQYCITNMHGDCGIKALLLITLARYNGIPAKWQSGWMMHPNKVNLHDWAEVYFEGYGWVPVDPDFGIQSSDNPEVKYFYTNGIDSYRLIVNDDYSQALFPSKIHPRSETIDFQRGEVEWQGGNLYFDKWDYEMKVEYSASSW